MENFKKVFDAVIEDDIKYEDYVNTVISIGLDAMLRTVIPEGHEWNTLQTAFDNQYENMCDIVAEMWKQDAEVEAEAMKRIRRGIEGYIH